MPTTSGRPIAADADTQACSPDDNDPLLKDPIDDEWMEKFDNRMCREFARQFIQQERMPMTTANESRLANIRALDGLYRTLERIARQKSVRSVVKATKHDVNQYEAFAALERRLLPPLEQDGAPETPKEA